MEKKKVGIGIIDDLKIIEEFKSALNHIQDPLAPNMMTVNRAVGMEMLYLALDGLKHRKEIKED